MTACRTRAPVPPRPTARLPASSTSAAYSRARSPKSVRRERQQLLDSRAPSGAGTASGASAPTSASTQDSSGPAATPEQLDKRSVQQGGGQ